MANFFNEKRHECECGSNLFVEEQTYLLIKTALNEYVKNPNSKIIRCFECRKIQNVKVKED